MDEVVPAAPSLFEAVIVPHRSLSPRGLTLLGAAILCASAVISGFFWAMGAWPVAGFGGTEVALALLLLHANARGRRASEVVVLTGNRLSIARTDPSGRRRERRLSPDWMSVLLEERAGRVPALWLVTRGVREEVGASLGEDEKRALASALRQALRRRASPVFDNPQLRS